MKTYDRIIVGGGIYGLYSALKSAEMGYHTLLLEKERSLFIRASSVNQARVHCGMHYLRAHDTAGMCAGYYRRFVRDHAECINDSFRAIYANASHGSLVSDEAFCETLDSLDIKHRFIETPSFLHPSSVSVCVEVEESSFDYGLLLSHYVKGLHRHGDLVDVHCGEELEGLEAADGSVIVNHAYKAGYLLNCTYASVNGVIGRFPVFQGRQFFDLRYELCEVVLCEVSSPLKNAALTVMDGQFFSIMPFGHSGVHSLTCVGHTPLHSSEEALPRFPCQGLHCSPDRIGLCDACAFKPDSCFQGMMDIVSRFLDGDMVAYKKSLFTVKPILKSSESTDSRPTAIIRHSDAPQVFSVLSGKISSIYELDSILEV